MSLHDRIAKRLLSVHGRVLSNKTASGWWTSIKKNVEDADRRVMESNSTKVIFGNKLAKLQCEIAADDQSQTIGLQKYASLPKGYGMLFPYDPPRDRVTFHMGSVPFDIDIIFVGSNGRVSKIVENAEPGTRDRWGMSHISAVIEANGGFCRENGIEVGCEVITGIDRQTQETYYSSIKVGGLFDGPFGLKNPQDPSISRQVANALFSGFKDYSALIGDTSNGPHNNQDEIVAHGKIFIKATDVISSRPDDTRAIMEVVWASPKYKADCAADYVNIDICWYWESSNGGYWQIKSNYTGPDTWTAYISEKVCAYLDSIEFNKYDKPQSISEMGQLAENPVEVQVSSPNRPTDRELDWNDDPVDPDWREDKEDMDRALRMTNMPPAKASRVGQETFPNYPRKDINPKMVAPIQTDPTDRFKGHDTPDNILDSQPMDADNWDSQQGYDVTTLGEQQDDIAPMRPSATKKKIR
jgi:uncharacterized membrane protein (UPF0127 family)